MGKRGENPPNEARPEEISAAIHYADDGPDLESCMVAILNAHLSKSKERL